MKPADDVIARVLREEHARIIAEGPKTFHPLCPDHAVPLSVILRRVHERFHGAVSRRSIGHVFARMHDLPKVPSI